jgi:hypothetical protein
MFRATCVASLIVLALVLVPVSVGHAQVPSAPVVEKAEKAEKPEKVAKSIFSEEGPVDTTWNAQLDSLQHALVRLPLAALLSASLAFRPRRRGTPKRQAPVIQTQIILAIVGATVMLVVGASLARAFGIVGAAGLIRYRAKIEDPKDAGVMLSTLAIGLASGVGLYAFAGFAAVFILAVLLVIESIDPEPFALYELEITAKDPASMKPAIEAVLRRRKIAFELASTSPETICYEVKLPLDTHTEKVSDALMSLDPAQSANVKWEHKKDKKAS